eukprot:scaffold137727_cov35-Tisochrysis_lutea.AAC.5
MPFARTSRQFRLRSLRIRAMNVFLASCLSYMCCSCELEALARLAGDVPMGQRQLQGLDKLSQLSRNFRDQV